jgi:DNA-binding phage protein
MSTRTDPAFLRSYDRQILRAKVQSMFWGVIEARKRAGRFTLQQLADTLGVNKSTVSRGFSEPQNWTIDKVSDMAAALGVDLMVEARDIASGAVYAPEGMVAPVVTSSLMVKPLVTDGRPLRGVTTSSVLPPLLAIAA